MGWERFSRRLSFCLINKVRSERIRAIFIEGVRPYLWLIGLVFVLYIRTVSFQFVYFDDQKLILDNYYFIGNLGNWWRALSEDVFISPVDAYYRPGLTWSLMLDALIGNNSPWIYHWTNVVIHGAVVVLLFSFIDRLGYGRGKAMLVAVLFAVHPALVPAVAWIPGRNDSLLLVWVLSALILFQNFLETGKPRWLVGYLIFWIFALFVKESAVMLVPLTLFWWWREKKMVSINSVFGVSMFYLVSGLFWFGLRQRAMVHPVFGGLAPMLESLVENIGGVGLFLGKAILPVNLTVVPIMRDSSLVYGVVVAVFLTVSFVLTKEKRWSVWLWGWMWFLLFLLPSLIRPDKTSLADFIEHRLYVPMIGIIIVLLESWPVKYIKGRWVLIALPVFAAAIAVNFSYQSNYRDRLIFWKSAVAGSPHHPLAHRNLGVMEYLDRNKQAAEIEFRKALELNPAEAMAHNNLGLIYVEKGDFQKAEEAYKKELEVNPNYDNALFNLGLLYEKTGREDEAEKMWKETLRINPYYTGAYLSLIKHYRENGESVKEQYYTGIVQTLGLLN